MERPTIRGASRQPLRALLFTGACAGMLLVFVPLQSATRALGGQPVATDVCSERPGYVEGVQPSDEVAGPILVSGRLVAPGGTPASGRVVVVAWPRAAALAALADGDPVKTLVIGQDIATVDGTFAIRADPTIPLGEYTEDDGTINLEIRAHGAVGTGLFAFSRRFLEREARWIDAGASLPGGGAGGREPAEVDVVLDGPAVAEDSVVPTGDKTGTCPDYIVATYRNILVDVGETYNGPVNTSRFVYQQGSTSSLGVGVSVSGAFGSYSAGGTAIGTTTNTITWPTTNPSEKRLYRTTYTYRKIDIWNGYYTCEHWRYEVRPVGWEGGSAWTALPYAPTATYCAPQLAGASYEKVTGTAYTFGSGVYLSGHIGINLSARTGFSTLTGYRFTFISAGQLCGTNANVPEAARIVGKGP